MNMSQIHWKSLKNAVLKCGRSGAFPFTFRREFMHIERNRMITTVTLPTRIISKRVKRVFSTTNKSQRARTKEEHSNVSYVMGAIAVMVFGMAYAAVPLYKAFCQMTGFGGTPQRVDEANKRKDMMPVEGADPIRVYFTADVHSAMPWKFIPTQKEIRIVPGETALAFYTVKNTADYAITGVATYNVFPPKAGLYFSKIQCFCFEEQRLGANEEIDMPVFFFIDPEVMKDPAMKDCRNITLSYTFFKTGDEKIEGIGGMDEEEKKKKRERVPEPVIVPAIAPVSVTTATR